MRITLIVVATLVTFLIPNALFAQGGWTDNGNTVRLTTTSDKVGIGTETVGKDTKVAVIGIVQASSFVEDGIYNVKAYGAKGDGTAYDGSKIQDAINAARAAGGGIVYFPQGTYRVNATLNIGTGQDSTEIAKGSNVILRGAGKSLSKILTSGIYTAINFRGGATPGAPSYHLAGNNEISGLTIENVGSKGISRGINMSGTQRSIVEKVCIKGYAYGIDVSKWLCKINNVEIINCDTGIGIHTIDANGTIVRESDIQNNGIGIFSNGCASTQIVSSHISDNTETGIYIYSDVNGFTLQLTIDGNEMEGNGKGRHNQIWISRSLVWGLGRGITISNNYFNIDSVTNTSGSYVFTPYEVIDAEQESQCIFFGNVYSRGTQSSDALCREGVYVGVAPHDVEDIARGRIEVRGDLVGTDLPNNQGASGVIWRDPADANTLKVAP